MIESMCIEISINWIKYSFRLQKWRKKMYRQAINEIRQEKYTVDTVHTAAQKILNIKAVGIPVKIIEICKNMGFSVFQQNLPKNICGYIAIDGELKDRFGTDRIITVNMNESNKRRRFTVAHELGHFLFDFNPNGIQFYNAFEHDHEENDVPSESLANRFAAELLMPEDKFRKEYRKIYDNHSGSSEQLYETIQDLSDLFLVPPKAVEMRIKRELKLHG